MNHKAETLQHREKEYLTPLQIFQRLIDIFGDNLSEVIKKRISENPNLDEIIIIGVPGSGKTTVLIALEQILIELGFTVKKGFFDKKRNSFLEIKKLHGENVTTLADLKNQESFALFIELAEKRENEQIHSENVFKLSEYPGIGETVERGQTRLKNIGLESKKNELPKKLVIHLIADERVYNFAKKVRRVVEKCNNDYELKIEMAKIGVFIGELKEADHTSTRMLQLFQKMASPKHIEEIGDEYMRMTKGAMKVMRKERGNHLATLAQQNIHMPDDLNMSQKEWDNVTKKALFALYYFLRVLGFRNDLMYLVAINPFTDKGVSFDIFDEELNQTE